MCMPLTWQLALPPKLHTRARTHTHCHTSSQVTFTDCQPEYVRMTLLNVPAVLIVLSTLFALDWYFGFGISAAISGGPYVSVGVL